MNWLDLPPLGALRAFAALAERGSFSAAGAALNVSHAAVSQQVRALEERLGATLVQRGGRQAALTAEGARLGGALGEAFSAMGAAVDELTQADADRPLHITLTPAFAAAWLMPRLSEFQHRHPGTELILNPTPDLLPLEPGGVDIAIRHGRGGWPGVEAELLIASGFVIVAAPSLVAGRSVSTPSDILDLPWLQEIGNSEIANWLTRHGVVAERRVAVTHLPGHLSLEALRGGVGVSVAARVLIESDIAAGRLVVLFEEIAPGEGYYVCTRPGVRRPPVRAFIAWLRRSIDAAAA